MRGEVIYLYAFDVANEIATHRIGEVLQNRALPFEVRTSSAYPKEVPLYQPLTSEPPQPDARLAGHPVRVIVRVFEVGVVSVALRVPFEVAALLELLPCHHPVLESGETCNDLARRLCLDVCDQIREFMIRDSVPTEPDAYTVFLLTDLGGERDANLWFTRQRRDIAGLLTEAQPDKLSAAQVEESVRIRRSYANTDLVVIDWDAALMVELESYAEDVLYVLELANLQLEELQVMDRRLDRHLERAYGDLERYRSPWFSMPNRMLAWLRRFRVDATKLTDEVTNITKFFGDWYLARVYLGAQERFHLLQWRQGIEQRLGQLDEIYQLIKGDVYERRMLWLEVAVVICFLIDLYAIFFWKS
jgi:hypothetical protein